MYHLHAFATPNSIKPVIALEELGLDYALHAVNVRKGEQKLPQFVELNPNAKVPVLTVSDGGHSMSLTESAAILVYLAERHGALLPSGGAPLPAWISTPAPTLRAGSGPCRSVRRCSAPSLAWKPWRPLPDTHRPLIESMQGAHHVYC